MLSAAVDIINSQSKPKTNFFELTTLRNCTEIGTASVLLADILPSVIIKLVAPQFIHRIHFHLKVGLACLLALASLIMVGCSPSMPVSLFGVFARCVVARMQILNGIVCASISSGIGDLTFLSMTAFFNHNCVSTWSSGTGAAGLVGAVTYAALTSLTTPRNTLFILIIVPICQGLVYAFVLDRPDHEKFKHCCRPTASQQIDCEGQIAVPDNVVLVHSDDLTAASSYSYSTASLDNSNVPAAINQSSEYPPTNVSTGVNLQQEHPSRSMKLLILKSMACLLISLAVVYFFEYLINQSLFELLDFSNTTLTRAEQYRWFQVLYQTGVFISRSSVNIVHLRWTWIMAILQCINFFLCLSQVLFEYIPNIWIMFVIILYEGLLGGLAYVNTFYRIIQESAPVHREYAMSSAAISDSIGISLAGFIAIPLHSWLCNMPRLSIA